MNYIFGLIIIKILNQFTMKYRIVKTESGDYRIQNSFFFGLFWKFYAEPVAYYSRYHCAFEVDDNEHYFYKEQKEAENVIQILKESPIWYKGHYIDAIKVNDTYGYFITKGRFRNSMYKMCYATIEEAKEQIDKDCEEENNEKKKEKIEQVIKYC